jgi:hypothetical protein
MNRTITVRQLVIGVAVLLGVVLILGAGHNIIPTRGGTEQSTIQQLVKKHNQLGWGSLTPAERQTLKTAYADYLRSLAVATDHAAKVHAIRGHAKGAEELRYHNEKVREAIAAITRSGDDDDPCIYQSVIDQSEGVLR